MGQKILKVDKIVSETGVIEVDGTFSGSGLTYQSQWTPANSTDIKYTAGKVGIGGSHDPAYTLDVGGTANVGVLTTTSVSGDGSGLTNIQISSIPGLIQEQWTTTNDGILNFDTGANRVGIGTETPGFTLDVHGTANVGILTATSVSGDGSGLTNIPRNSVIGEVDTPWSSIEDDIRYQDGNVGIGIGGPNHLLDVNGNVNATTLSLSEYDRPVYLTPNADVASIAQWAKEIGGDTNIVHDIAIDSNGNTFVTGEYTSSSGVTIGGVSLSATTGTNVYLIKYTPGGTAEWALNLEGLGRTVAVDSDGNVYISGTYNSSENVNVPSTDGNPLIGKLVPTTRIATFLIKYDNAGVAQWATHLDGTYNNGNDIGRNLAIDSDSNVYLTGSYNGYRGLFGFNNGYSYAYSADDISPSIQLPIANNDSAFLVKYNSSGTVQWVKGIDASGGVFGYGVATDTTSNVYITGRYIASTEVDVGDSKTLPVTTGVASFLIKYDTTGTTQWTKKIDGSSTDEGVSLVTGKDGNVHILGNYTSGAIVISPFITLPDTSGITTTFLVTYDTQGVAQWATTIDGSGNDVVTDSTGAIFVTGEYSSSGSNISSTDGKNVTLENPTGDATFLVEYSPNGILRSSTHIDGTSNGNRKAIATDTLGENVCISGTTGSNSVIYNSDGTPSGLTLTSGPGFVVKYEISKSLKLNVSSNLEVGTANLFVNVATGRVGLNTTTPQSTLHVEGNVYASSNLEVGGANLFVDTQTSRVGLGTRTPEATLHVEGNVYVSSNLEVSNINFTGSFIQNGTPFVSSPWTTTGNDLSYTTGRVGIGTSTPEATLHVEGNVYASSNLEVGGANLFVDTQTSRVGLGTRTPEATLHVEGNVYASSNLEVGTANLFVDTQTSRIGLGMRTPEATLHVEGNVYASSNLEVGTANLFVDTEVSRVGVRTRVPGFDLDVNGDINFTGDFYKNGVLFTTVVGSTPWSPLESNISYTAGGVAIGIIDPEATLHVEGNVYVSSNLEVGGANLFVDTVNSRVGIGTATPEATLHVEGDINVASNLEVSNINFTGSFNQNGTPFVSSPWTTTGNDLSYTTGRVGIGTSTPEATLHVEGDINVASNLEVSNINFTGSFNQNGTPFVSSPWTTTGNDLSYTTGRVGVANLEVGETTISSIVSDGVPNVSWAKSIGGTGSDDVGNAIATDSDGNVYVIGTFRLGDVTIGTDTLTNAGDYDVFVAKYDTSGTVQWARSIGGSSPDKGYSISVDSSGNVYATGEFRGTADFGSGTSLTSGGSPANDDAFVVKYNTSGTVQWARSIGGTSPNSGYGIATDSSGNVFVTGGYSGTITIGSTELTSTSLSVDIFVAKCDTNGTFIWARSIGNTNTDRGYGIATDSSGNVYVIGYYSGIADFGSTALTSAGSFDVFVVKYDTDGIDQWAKSIGGSFSDHGYGIATDSSGNVYVTGYYSGTANFWPGTSLNSVGYSFDAFVAKYDTSGTFQWARSIGGTDTDKGNGIATDSAGNVYVIGEYRGNITIGSTTLTNTDSSFYSDIFVAKYDTSGTVQWADSIGGVNGDIGLGIATDSTENVYVTGYYEGTITIGSTTLTNTDSFLYDAFVAKYSPSRNLNINTRVDIQGNAYVASNLEVGTANLFVDTQISKVGVGTATPEATLHVEGNVYVSSNLEVGETTISSIVSDGVPNVSWAKSIGGTGSDDVGNAIATDSDGNVYVIGQYRDEITLGTITLNSAGGTDAFVAKYDTSGTVQWAKSIGNTSFDYGYGIATDSSGNVYVTGGFRITADFGSGTSLNSAGGIDGFVAKYDTSGTVEWAESIGGTSSISGYGIATDSSGNVYVTGFYQGTANFGSGTSLNSNAGNYDVFIAKYNTSGTAQWATRLGATGYDEGRGIATDSAGNVYVTGYYSGNTTFGGITLTSNAGSSDAFVVKYDTSGTAQWAESIGGGLSDHGYGIAADSSGNVYVTGRYNGNITIGTTQLTNAGGEDAFVAKYNTSGIVQWARKISGTGSDRGNDIVTDSAGNVYVTGYYENTITIGSTQLTSVGSFDVFVAKYDTSGTAQWAKTIGGADSNRGYSISVDSSGNVYVTGQYSGTADFGPSTSLTSAGAYDVFIAKYSSPYKLNINTSVDIQGDLNVSGTTTNVSDKRLKSNVHVIENALEKVDKLSGYTFTMNNKNNAGVIAQEVLEVLPEVVGGSEETTYSVAYGNMAGLFIEAIKELKREIEILKTKD
jgi:hypothetical protein